MGTSHRQAPVKNLVGRVREGLGELFSLPDGYEVVLGNGGATAFWDIATFGLIREKSQHLTFGEFSSKFAKAAAAGAVPGRPVGDRDRPGHPARAACRGGRRRLRLGAQRDLHRRDGPRQAGRPTTARWCSSTRPPAPAACRSTSAEIDVYYFAPQKSFASDGGLWIALMSPAALERAASIAASDRWIPAFFDLPTAIDNSAQEPDLQHPVGRDAVPDGRAARLDERPGRARRRWSQRTTASSDALYGWAERTSYTTPYVTDPAHRSLVIGTIDFDESIDADAVAEALRANGIVDTEPYRKLGRNQLRVAMYPAIDPADVEALTECIDYVVGQL